MIPQTNPRPWPAMDSRPLLGANGTEAMSVLLAQDGAHLVDYLKVGPFMGEAAIAALAEDHPLLLHLDNTLSGHDPLSEATIRRVQGWIDLTNTPWTSAHIGFGVADVVLDEAHINQPAASLLPRERALENIQRNASQLAESISAPLLLENLPFFPNSAHVHVCEPAFCTAVLQATGLDMLLDLAHARVSADVLGYEVHDYLSQLPLDRVVEIHLSGPRRLHEMDASQQSLIGESAQSIRHLLAFREDNLVDAHEPLQEEDYALLEWTLGLVQPKAISLEYFRHPAALRQQLERLAGIIGRPIEQRESPRD